MSRTAAQIRREFIDFFVQKCGHTFVPSSPVVPHDDPTLLFANAGMNQFKPYFLGTQTPPWRRVANTQKCIRAGGKHNDLDDVGHDTYHHTFFEMLGNWSFGDYFKAEAIAWAWELLTEVWGIDPTRLHATYFRGDPAEHLEPDTEARDLWLKILPPERVHAGSQKDNFWEMGETGPCGPCSEIHIDRTPDKCGGALVNAGDARVMEIWNLVFIQFNRGPDGSLTPLPARHVDTGMGFERVTAVLQGHRSNYDTDVFTPLFAAIREATQAPPYQGRLESETSDPGVLVDVAYRVVADHIRTLTFAITDGAVPDKDGRGYVLRRILRRAVRYGWQYLSVHEPFLYRIVPTVIAVLGDAFPELRSKPAEVISVIRDEEESFARTLGRGLALFEEAATTAARDHHGEIRGDDAFRLHDTYGFPIDLTQIMAAERGLRVDIGEYERLMEEARERARAGGKGDAAGFDHLPQTISDRIVATDDRFKYETETLAARVLTIIRRTPEGAFVTLGDRERLRPGEDAVVVCDRTCFYGEAGGQVGDRGNITAPDGTRFEVSGTLKPGHYVQHVGTLITGSLGVGDSVELAVDPQRRATMKNHTGTHVLNWALRAVLGEHVMQKGSLVDPEKTRFDFAHPKALTPEEVERVERLANEQIARGLPVHIKEIPQAEALRINGLRAVFGERYPEIVRVMSIGVPVEQLAADPGNAAWRDYSIEFCGGTHVRNTREIGHLAVVAEEAIAKGVRRIVAYTGLAAQVADEMGAALVQRVTTLLRQPPPGEELAAAASELANTLGSATIPLRHRARLRELLTELQKRVKDEQKAAAGDAAGALAAQLEEQLRAAPRHGEVALFIGELPEAPADQIKQAIDAVKPKCGPAAIVVGTRTAAAGDEPGKVTLVVAFTPDLVKKGLKAGDLVKVIAPVVGGGGGGPPTMAQAGGKHPEKLAEALETAREWIRTRLG